MSKNSGTCVLLFALCPLFFELGCDALWQPFERTFVSDCSTGFQGCQTGNGLGDGGLDGGPGDGPGSWPASCAEWHRQGMTIDQDYTLYVGGDGRRPYIVWCSGMGGSAPSEYLYLQNSTANVSRYRAPTGTVATSYKHVRLNPVTLQVICDDQADVIPIGVQFYAGLRVSSMPFGVAASATLGPASAGIDLTGTAFAVAPNAFSYYRDETKSTIAADSSQAAYKSNNQVVTLTAPAGTGEFLAPNPGSNHPFNNTSGLALQLTYVGM